MTGRKPLSPGDLFLTQRAAMAAGLKNFRYHVRDWEELETWK